MSKIYDILSSVISRLKGVETTTFDKKHKDFVVTITETTVDGETTCVVDKTFAEIETAINKGRTIVFKVANSIAHLTGHSPGKFIGFEHGNAFYRYVYMLTSSDMIYKTMSNLGDYLHTSQKSTAISADSTDYQYPSAKAVVDYVRNNIDSIPQEVYIVDFENPNYEKAYAAYESGATLFVTNCSGTDKYPLSYGNGYTPFLRYSAGITIGSVTLPAEITFMGFVFSDIGWAEINIILNANNIITAQIMPIRKYINTKIGGTMEAPLILAADPTEDLEAATKKYVETSIEESKADWSQNDESAADYIKNRTHWDESFILDSSNLTGIYKDISPDVGFAQVSDTPVDFDNIKDIIFIQEGSTVYGYGNVQIGNYGNYATLNIKTDNGELTTVAISSFEDNNVVGEVYNRGTEIYHSFTNFPKGTFLRYAPESRYFMYRAFTNNVHTLDPKYIPSLDYAPKNMLVTFSTEDSTNWTADKTHQEVQNQVLSGGTVTACTISTAYTMLNLTYYMINGPFVFGIVAPNGDSFELQLFPDNTVRTHSNTSPLMPMDDSGFYSTGTAGQFLTSNGDGTTSWTTVQNGEEVAY